MNTRVVPFYVLSVTLIPAYKATNTVTVPETLGTNILTVQGGTFHIFSEGLSGDYSSRQS